MIAAFARNYIENESLWKKCCLCWRSGWHWLRNMQGIYAKTSGGKLNSTHIIFLLYTHCLFCFLFKNLVILDFIENATAVQGIQNVDKNCKVVYIKMDITDKKSIKQAITKTVALVKYIDVLVNGAGVIADRNVELTMNVNLTGLINTTFEAWPYMDKTQTGRGGMVVNIASVLGLEPCPPIAVYSASKFGVIGFTRSLAVCKFKFVMKKLESTSWLSAYNMKFIIFF